MRNCALCALGLGIAAVGCAGLPVCMEGPQYVMVERRESQLAGLSPRAEITETPTYKVLRSKFKTVALRLPDNCFQRANLSEGMNVEAAPLESTCGVPLQVLESTLTKAGFQVLSWSTLMGIERQQRVPVHIAARQLGADVVIIVNAMYAGPRKAGASAEATYRYYESDPDGARRGPTELFQSDRAWLKEFIRSRRGADARAQQSETLQAELNATVLLVRGAEASPSGTVPGATETQGAAPPAGDPAQSPASGAGRSGESIWFYNWSLGTVASEREMRFLFGGIPANKYKEVYGTAASFDTSDPNRHHWWPVAPNVEPAPEPRDRAASEERFASRVDVGPTEAAVLYRRIAEDFIARFKGG